MDNNITICREPVRRRVPAEGFLNRQPKQPIPFDPDLRLDLPLELLVIRLAGTAYTAEQRQQCLSAWRQCLKHGPTPTRRPKAKTTTPAAGHTFTKDTAAVAPHRVEQLQRCLEAV